MQTDDVAQESTLILVSNSLLNVDARIALSSIVSTKSE